MVRRATPHFKIWVLFIDESTTPPPPPEPKHTKIN